MRKYFPSSKVYNFNTFLAKLPEVGVIVPAKKQRLHKSTRRVIDLFYSDFKAAYGQKYKGHNVTEWVTESEDSFTNIAMDIGQYAGQC